MASRKKITVPLATPRAQKLAILDAGAQYGKVIDRKVRELQVESEILPLDTPTAVLKRYRAFIISGGPQSVYGDKAPKFNPDIFTLGKPVLGICYGLQLMVHVFGGVIEKKSKREDGPCRIVIETDSPLFQTLDPQQTVLMTHGDTVDQPAAGFRVIADSEGLIAGVEDQERKLYGVQFHPEVDLTEQGKTILKNFLFTVAGFAGTFTLEDREQTAINYIQKCVKNNKVLVLVSGGVDSAVLATLLGKALKPEQVLAVHIDTGFMRQNESAQVKRALRKAGINLRVIDAHQQFYTATTSINGHLTKPLNQITSPEEKRKIIGDTFMRVAERVMTDLKLDPETVFLAQGSLRPDLIESASSLASGNAAVIKTHHNDTPLVRELRDKGRVIEPLQAYHKDEVRALGASLGLPDEIIWRQPFPGPGLAIRILCADKPFITPEFDQLNQKLKQDFSDKKIAATLLPVRTVGVQGDGRSYSYLAGLSSNQTVQQVDWQRVLELARAIPKTLHQVNRIVYIFGPKMTQPVRTITPTHLTLDVIDQLRQADAIVNQILLNYGLIRSLSQVPVIVFPVTLGEKGSRVIGIRTFITNDFMTGVPAIPGQQMPFEALGEMVARILAEVAGIARVAYDMTSKPPGTTEWE